MTLLLITVFTALLCGFTGGYLYAKRPKRQHGLDRWEGPRREPEPQWAEWNPQIGRLLKR